MISAGEALAIISGRVAVMPAVTVSLQESLGSFLAEEVRSTENVPPFDNAAMDGFAVRAEDIREVPCALTLAGEVSAGMSQLPVLHRREAVRIMTGAPIPPGCTAVVQQEWTKSDDTSVTIMHAVTGGHNIRKAGADIASGSLVLTSGSEVRPQEIGVLASLGRRFVSVHKRPRVAILPTGNELVDIEKTLAPGKIRNSNAQLLLALVRALDCEGTVLPAAQDEVADLETKLRSAFASDIVITTGGVSVGKYDLVRDALRNLGVDILFNTVNIKPGMPLVFGMMARTPVFGLPGNPVSTAVTFMQFVRPAIDLMAGQRHPSQRVGLKARLLEPIVKSDGKRHFIRGILGNDGNSLVVRPTGPQVSNILTSLRDANCLIIVPEEIGRYQAGDFAEIELLS